MEVKSNNVLIGAFTILGFVGALIFALWVGSISLDRTFEYYEVVFQGSVSGLRRGSAVQYNGITVGQVTRLHLDENDPSKVVALIEVDEPTPVKDDSIARLEYAGLTGTSFIQLSGGSAGSPDLKAGPDQEYPVIVAEQSPFQELYATAPQILQHADELVLDARALIAENQKDVKDILRNLEAITASLADNTGGIQKTLANLEATSANLENLSRSTTDIVEAELPALAREADRALGAYRQAADDLSHLVTSNQAPIDRFTREGLGQVPELVSDLRATVDRLDQLFQRFEQNPIEFVAGQKLPEVEAN